MSDPYFIIGDFIEKMYHSTGVPHFRMITSQETFDRIYNRLPYADRGNFGEWVLLNFSGGLSVRLEKGV